MLIIVSHFCALIVYGTQIRYCCTNAIDEISIDGEICITLFLEFGTITDRHQSGQRRLPTVGALVESRYDNANLPYTGRTVEYLTKFLRAYY